MDYFRLYLYYFLLLYSEGVQPDAQDSYNFMAYMVDAGT